jgi:hypothetical protein
MSVGLKANVDGSGAIQVGGTDAITLSTGLNATFVQNANLPNTFGFKNRIINGAMEIDQRNAGASVTPVNAQYLVDRFLAGLTQASKFTAQQNAGSVTPPAGFKNYLGVTSSSSYSILAGDIFYVAQAIEGLNLIDLAWGTASAATVTLSFQVRSSLTGTFGGSITNSAANRTYPFTYSITSANTWTTISVTIPGDTSGTWLTTNGIGMYVFFSLGIGSSYSGTAGAWSGNQNYSATGATSVVGTNAATLYITGVQLEKGSTATSYDVRPYPTELQLCQRYYNVSSVQVSGATSASAGIGWAYYYKSEMRANPTIAFSSYSVTGQVSASAATFNITTSMTGGYFGTSGTGFGTGYAVITATAEL